MSLHNQLKIQRPVIKSIVTQHIDEAGFDYLARPSELWNPLFTKEDIVLLDERIKANLEGSLIAGEYAFECLFERLKKFGGKENIFITTILLAFQYDEQHYLKLEGYLLSDLDMAKAAGEALCWVSKEQAESIALFWYESSHDFLRVAGFIASIKHGLININQSIEQALYDESAAIRELACRVISEHQLQGFHERLLELSQENDIGCQFEALVALTLSGGLNSIITIKDLLPLINEEIKQKGILIWSMFASSKDYWQWYLEHQNKPETYRTLLWSLAYRGDPAYLPRIVKFIKSNIEPKLAGNTFAHITGVDLVDDDLSLRMSDIDSDNDDLFENENPSDADLPYPDANAINNWFEKNQNQFKSNQKYVHGKLLENSIEDILLNGFMPQRWQATIYAKTKGYNSYIEEVTVPLIPAAEDTL